MLSALAEYGSQLGGEPGFKSRRAKWRVDLSVAGKVLNVVPMGDAKTGALVRGCPEMPSMVAGGRSHFLIESAQTVALHFKAREEMRKVEAGKVRHEFFKSLLVEASRAVPALSPLATFLAEPASLEVLRGLLEANKVKPSDWLSWRIGGVDPLESEDVRAWWRRWRQADLAGGTSTNAHSRSGEMMCLLTGRATIPLRTQPKISGLAGVGGLAMGDALVGFDKAAFQSYGLDQSLNAAMGEMPAQRYVDGLNDLIQTQSKRLANVLVVYWFKNRVLPTDDPLAYLYGLESDDVAQASALAQARSLLGSVREGKRPDLAENTFFALTLSGAAGRVMVRDWMEGAFEELIGRVVAWFDALSIVHRDGGELARVPKFMAVCGALVRELKDLPPSTTTALWRAAIHGHTIPSPLLHQALDRCRSAILKDELPNHARMGLVRAYFLRKSKGDAEAMKTHLNPDHPSTAYQCGRLLAVLSGLQTSALGDVGAGVVQRFYPSASQSPGLTLGRLIGNSRNHLTKLQPGLAWWYEELIAEIMGRMGDAPPRTLDLEGQGLFALGYYQQLADLRQAKKSQNKSTETGAKE